MNELFFNVVLVSFPILVYFIICMINIIFSKGNNNNIFIIAIITSLYLIMYYNYNINKVYLFLMFSNIPILVSYIKRNYFLGIILSLVVIVYLFMNSSFVVTSIRLFIYLILFIIFNSKSTFNYLFIKMCALLQGLLVSLEYNFDISNLLFSFTVLIIIFGIVFLIIFLFRELDNITKMYECINNTKKEIDLKNSLFKLTHEIKNPIAVCKGYLDMIDLNDYNNSCRYIDIIKNEINRSLNIMNDFMECSKIKIDKEEFDVSILLENVYESFKILCKKNNIKFNYNNNLEEIYVLGDYNRLEQVLVNIIKNSMEAIKNNGVIDIDVNVKNKDVIIKVKDNGIGMDEYELENVKEMFYTTKREGTGLGVALSNEIVLLHNGSLEYDSVKNKGTTCTIRIPMEG